jgi:hypothetical protein
MHLSADVTTQQSCMAPTQQSMGGRRGAGEAQGSELRPPPFPPAITLDLDAPVQQG